MIAVGVRLNCHKKGIMNMDYFGACFDCLCLAGQCILHMLFLCRLTGKQWKAWYFAVLLLLVGVFSWIGVRLSLGGTAGIGIWLVILYGMNRLVLRNHRTVSWTATILTVYISQLSFGMINSVEAVLFPRWIGKTFLYLLVLLASAASFMICVGCCRLVLDSLSLKDRDQLPYIGLLLFPGLFFFVAEWYILQTAYTTMLPVSSLAESGKHVALLFLQLLGLGAFVCTLYAYRRICHDFQTREELRSLTQAIQAQKVYISEARTRYEQTRAFRHDIKNHLSVLSGLLNNERLEEGREYLKKLNIISDSLSFPCHTGNPVVDILLGEKLGLAKSGGIAVQVSLDLPGTGRIDDLDLCVIFGNALDNAVTACRSVQGEKSIVIRGERQGDFYMLGFENTCAGEGQPHVGTGLANIRSVAEKYRGAMLMEKAHGQFCLSVLLDISGSSLSDSSSGSPDTKSSAGSLVSGSPKPFVTFREHLHPKALKISGRTVNWNQGSVIDLLFTSELSSGAVTIKDWRKKR